MCTVCALWRMLNSVGTENNVQRSMFTVRLSGTENSVVRSLLSIPQGRKIALVCTECPSLRGRIIIFSQHYFPSLLITLSHTTRLHFANAPLSIEVGILIGRMVLSVNFMQHSENRLQSPQKFPTRGSVRVRSPGYRRI